MEAINTFYNGNYFRSRLEAKWAVFFDEMGIKYQYEPEGFTNGQGQAYLPDFFLPDVFLRSEKGVYIEIKPDNFKFPHPAAKWFNRPLVLFMGMPAGSLWGSELDHGHQIFPFEDNRMNIWMCHCGIVKIDFCQSNYAYCPTCNSREHEWLRIKKAVEASQKIRF